jgi:chromosome segregation protein
VLGEAERLVAERTQAADQLAGLVERRRSGLAEERDRLEGLRLEQIRIAAERTDLMRSAGELRERESQLARRGERLATELREAETEAERIVAARTELEAARDRALAELAALMGQREELAVQLAARERGLADAETRLADARLTLAARTSAAESLRELERVREGYDSGVRAIFEAAEREGRVGVDGVVGTVADLLDVPPDLERAVEAVLAERLAWVVVERFDQARAAVAFLQERGAGAATFLPLECLRAPEPLPEDDGVRWIARRVTAPRESLVHFLLGQVAIVDHLDQAETLWRRNGVSATYVTPNGEVLAPTGRLRGGAGGGEAQHSLLARKRQLRELDEQVRELTETVGITQTTVAQTETDVAALRARIAECEQTVGQRQAERVAGEKDLEQAIREHEREHRHAETVRFEAGQVTRESDETRAMLARLEQRVAAAREAETAHESTIRGIRDALENAQAEETALVTQLTACRVEVGSIGERVEALGRELVRADQMEADLTQRLEQGKTRQRQLGERRVWLEEERQRTDSTARDVAMDRDRAEAAARQAAEAHETLLDELRGIEQELRAGEGDLHRVVSAMHELELQATERRVRREELALDAQRTYGVDAAALLARHDPNRDLVALGQRVRELAEKLSAIGPVNLVADEEYRELDERLTFLRTQHDDLTASIKDLEKALRGMTHTAQERFVQAFEQINRDFAKIFERLFEGGRAELRLVEAEEGGDPLDTGVDLMAQPRGKRLQSVTLLSGGERALTGLALLFAIFYFRPSPFCVLDEVDAPLDDANIHRFLRVLRELTSQTQFLVITHNRRTMEAADVLYGVTMEEPGLSKLVSVNLNPDG